jgi:hypothetical protein
VIEFKHMSEGGKAPKKRCEPRADRLDPSQHVAPGGPFYVRVATELRCSRV